MGQLLTLLPLTNHQCKMGTRPNEGGLPKKKKKNSIASRRRSAVQGSGTAAQWEAGAKRRKEMKLAGIKQGLTSSSVFVQTLINAKDEEWKKTALLA